jgi:ribosome-associated protein
MTGIADLSIEFAHLYLGQLDEQEAERAARLARRWLGPVLTSCEDAGVAVSTVVMLDDYFAPEGTDLEAMVRLLDDACAAEGVRIDHLAHESACAESVVQMRAHLCREPREGDGSSVPPPAIGAEWLANADPPRERGQEQRMLRRTARTRPEAARLAADARLNGNGSHQPRDRPTVGDDAGAHEPAEVPRRRLGRAGGGDPQSVCGVVARRAARRRPPARLLTRGRLSSAAAMRDIPIRNDTIRLGQLLKLAGIADSGADAKELLAEGAVSVNGEPEQRRGRQLRRGDVIAVGDEQLRIA